MVFAQIRYVADALFGFFPRRLCPARHYEMRRLGQAASHGCVRLLPVNAAALFALLRKEGKSDTRIAATDAALPVAGRPMAEQPPPQPMGKAEAKIQTEIKVPLPPQFEAQVRAGVCRTAAHRQSRL